MTSSIYYLIEEIIVHSCFFEHATYRRSLYLENL